MKRPLPLWYSFWQFLARCDWPLMFIAAAILGVGLVVQWSVSGPESFPDGHVIRIAAAVVAGIFAASIPAKTWRAHVYLIYAVCLLALIWLLVSGRATNNARRWIDLFGGFKLQPSEFMKLALLLTLAKWFSERPRVERLEDLIVPAVLCCVPAVLILAQPDLGTALSYAPMFLGVAYLAGVPWRALKWAILFPLILAPFVWFTLKDYQRERIDIWLNQENLTADQKNDTGYHLWHSKLAIGSGGQTGFGWSKGPENRLDRLPERHNDFIFPVVAEEFGFIGAVSFLLLYSSLAFAIFWFATKYRDPFTRITVAGVGLHFAVHLCLNVGVTLGLWPTTGLPLPMVSWGGSSMMVSGGAIGLVFSLGASKEPVFIRRAFGSGI